jgi:radical SAM protein with 4Fe4S-binding SPASM domain
MMLRVCGFVFCHNEEHILRECLQHYAREGIDLVVVDNASTDSSMQIVEDVRRDPGTGRGTIRDILHIETEGYEWKKILFTACNYMHSRLRAYDWILLIDADSFYHSPVRGITLLEFIDQAGYAGYNILDGALYEFYPTERDDPAVVSPLERLKYCKAYHPYPQHRIFRYHSSIDFYTHFGHVCLRERPRVCCVQFLYLHYKWVSYEHGRKKLFAERLPRFVERRQHSRFHPQYLGLLPVQEDLVKSSASLTLFRKEAVLISRNRFEMMMRVHPVFDIGQQVSTRTRRMAAGAVKRWKAFRTVFGYSRSMAIRLAKERTVALLKIGAPRPIARAEGGASTDGTGFYRKDLSQSNFWVVKPEDWIEQKPYADGVPQNYHFLMTDFCNARCIFCNQDFTSTRQISLRDFQTMVSHIPATQGSNFFLSGGGEPLLCRDIFPIIHYINAEFPWVPITIKSNGLLVGKFAEQIAQCRIQRFGISVHGATRESNNAVLRANNENLDVFDGIGELNEQLLKRRNRTWKIFYVVVSRVNIDEVPALVEKAAELRVNEIMVMFSKVFPGEFYETHRIPPAKPEDSLFFHQERYNRSVIAGRKLAKSLGVAFRHEPLFGEPFKPQPCFIPWHTMVVNWDGEVYPCTGGEVWFRPSVKSGEYKFGNLLNQHLADFWNNESYTKIRRTTSRQTNEQFVPQCRNCHNTCCFEGPDRKASHILELNSTPKHNPLQVIACG